MAAAAVLARLSSVGRVGVGDPAQGQSQATPPRAAPRISVAIAGVVSASRLEDIHANRECDVAAPGRAARIPRLAVANAAARGGMQITARPSHIARLCTVSCGAARPPADVDGRRDIAVEPNTSSSSGPRIKIGVGSRSDERVRQHSCNDGASCRVVPHHVPAVHQQLRTAGKQQPGDDLLCVMGA